MDSPKDGPPNFEREWLQYEEQQSAERRRSFRRIARTLAPLVIVAAVGLLSWWGVGRMPRKAPMALESARDKQSYIRFLAAQTEFDCCQRILEEPLGVETRAECVAAFEALASLQARPYPQPHAEEFNTCPGALLFSLGGKKALGDPLPTLAMATSSLDRSKAARALGAIEGLSRVARRDAARWYALLDAPLRSSDVVIFARAAGLAARHEVRAEEERRLCATMKCSPPERPAWANATLEAIDKLRPAVRTTASGLVPSLVSCLTDGRCGDRSGAAWALAEAGNAGEAGTPELIALLDELSRERNADSRIPLRALVNIAGFGSTRVPEELMAFARRAGNPLSRTAAFEALASIDSTREDGCRGLAENISESVLLAEGTGRAFERLRARCGSAAPILFERLRATRDDTANARFLREQLIRALETLRPSSDPFLRDALAKETDARARNEIERVLMRELPATVTGLDGSSQ